MSAKQKSERLPGEKRPRKPNQAKLENISSPDQRRNTSKSSDRSVKPLKGNASDRGPKSFESDRSIRSKKTTPQPAEQGKRNSRYTEAGGSRKANQPQPKTFPAGPRRNSETVNTYGQNYRRRETSPETEGGFKSRTTKQKHPNTWSKGHKSLDEGIERRDKSEFIRLNKYLADAGICSRREADKYIQAGVVKVNDIVVTELGTKVSIHDKVEFEGQLIRREKLRYVLLNKPKGYITTSDDPYERKTVMELVANACPERIYPVGRLDRNTTGLLLLTNDGELAKKLTHPSHGAVKLYHVWLDKPLARADLQKIANGVELEDGLVEVDAISYVDEDESHKQVGIQLHSGRNRVVRRLFEHLGYEVVKLDRPMFAGLTKLKLGRGHWRFLTPAEINMLKRIR